MEKGFALIAGEQLRRGFAPVAERNDEVEAIVQRGARSRPRPGENQPRDDQGQDNDDRR